MSNNLSANVSVTTTDTSSQNTATPTPTRSRSAKSRRSSSSSYPSLTPLANFGDEAITRPSSPFAFANDNPSVEGSSSKSTNLTAPVVGTIIDGAAIVPFAGANTSNQRYQYRQHQQQMELWKGVRAEQMRDFITRSVISLFVLWALIGMVTLVATGNFWLLVSSPTMLTYPLLKVIDYYFGSTRTNDPNAAGQSGSLNQ